MATDAWGRELPQPKEHGGAKDQQERHEFVKVTEDKLAEREIIGGPASQIILSWPPEKLDRYYAWFSEDRRLQELAEQHKKVDLQEYVQKMYELDFTDKEAVRKIYDDTTDDNSGPLPDPLWLFAIGNLHFYLCSGHIQYHFHKRNTREHEDIMKSGAYQNWLVQFRPALDPPQTFGGSKAATPFPLEFALPLGNLSCGSNGDINDRSSLSLTPFVVFLHPADKSLWAVFNYLLPTEERESESEDEDGDDQPLEVPNFKEVGFWKEKDFPSFALLRIQALFPNPATSPPGQTERRYLQHNEALDQQDEGYSSDEPLLEVVISKEDPPQKILVRPTNVRPRPYVASHKTFQDYMSTLRTAAASVNQPVHSKSINGHLHNPASKQSGKRKDRGDDEDQHIRKAYLRAPAVREDLNNHYSAVQIDPT